MPRKRITSAASPARRATKKRATKTSPPKVAENGRPSPSKRSPKKTTAKKTSKTPQKFVEIKLQTGTGESVVFSSSTELQRAAVQWSYVLRNRRRWNTSEADIAEQALRAKDELKKFGIKEAQLQRLAESDVVEVSIPYTSEAEGWEARIFPWEYMLSAATRAFRDGKLLTVIRHLDRQQQSPSAPKRKISKALIVESAPGEVRSFFSFDSERNLVTTKLELTTQVSIDEPRDALRDRIAAYAPDVIHLSGVDNNQAAAKGWIDRKEVYDGYVMKATPDGMEGVTAQDLARILNAAEKKPALVCSNVFYSAARIGALAVAEGAEAAIGFQDELDDALMELFFVNFYDSWRRLKWDLLEAFNFALAVLKGKNAEITPTGGIVLWSDRSLVKPVTSAVKSTMDTEKEKILCDKEKVLTLKDFQDQNGRPLLSIEVKSCPSLNYSMLHNNGRLFEKFLLRKEKVGRLKNINVEVVLYVGKESSRFSCSTDMVDSPLDLNQLIHVPLIYSTELLNNENIHTGLYVEIVWENQVLHRQTHRVTLPPLDEWRGNDDLDRVWLPSFLLPRDPAIYRIVDAGQNYVMTLRDDSTKGFDGYQCIDPNAEVPEACVDQQVRALWSALLYNFNISYINPPPTYNLAAQRLRTPTEIIEGRRGTCIDLALLFAACLEYVDIYPVIFLLKNHAFPGFWRSSSYQDAFRKVTERSQAVSGSDPGDLSTVQRWPWYHSMNAYDEIMDEINHNRLYPIETMGLTQRKGYEGSVLEAIAKLENKEKYPVLMFEGMIDVMQARNSLITPIPRR